MNELSKLKLSLGIDNDRLDDRLALLLEDAASFVANITRRKDVSAYQNGIRAVAAILYNRIGQEGLSSYSAGDITLSFEELPDAVRALLPSPLASVAGRRFEYVETQSGQN